MYTVEPSSNETYFGTPKLLHTYIFKEVGKQLDELIWDLLRDFFVKEKFH